MKKRFVSQDVKAIEIFLSDKIYILAKSLEFVLTIFCRVVRLAISSLVVLKQKHEIKNTRFSFQLD